MGVGIEYNPSSVTTNGVITGTYLPGSNEPPRSTPCPIFNRFLKGWPPKETSMAVLSAWTNA